MSNRPLKVSVGQRHRPGARGAHGHGRRLSVRWSCCFWKPPAPPFPHTRASTLPRGAGATQWWPRDEGQHFRSPGQSVSSTHGEAGASGPTTGQTPGLEANSLDRFRAGAGSD